MGGNLGLKSSRQAWKRMQWTNGIAVPEWRLSLNPQNPFKTGLSGLFLVSFHSLLFFLTNIKIFLCNIFWSCYLTVADKSLLPYIQLHSVVEVTNNFLAGFKTYFMRFNPCLTVIRYPKTWYIMNLGENQVLFTVLLKEYSNIIIFYYTHRQVPHWAIKRETSCSAWKLTETHNSTVCMGDLEAFNPKLSQ